MIWRLFMGAALGACTLTSAAPVAQDDPMAQVRDLYRREHSEQIAAAARACRERRGAFGYQGLGLAPVCSIRNPDGGRICRSSSDCRGECVVANMDFSLLPRGTPATGQCTAVSPHFGCFVPIENGVAGQAICAD